MRTRSQFFRQCRDFLRRCSLFFLFLLSASILSAAVLLFPENLFAGYDFESQRPYNGSAPDPSVYSRQQAERIRNSAESLVPQNKRSCRILISTGADTEKGPRMRYNAAKKEVSVILPQDVLVWTENAEYLHTVTAWILLARVGENPRNADLVRNHWIVRAVARKTVGDGSKVAMPMSRYSPAAYTLTANGYLPELRMILGPDISGTSSAMSSLEDEYSELLLDYCRYYGICKNDLIAKILYYSIKNPQENQLRLFLAAAVSSGLENSIRTRTERKNAAGGIGYAEVNDSFRKFVQQRLISFFTPMSQTQLEKQYRELRLVRFSNRLPEEKPKRFQGGKGKRIVVSADGDGKGFEPAEGVPVPATVTDTTDTAVAPDVAPEGKTEVSEKKESDGFFAKVSAFFRGSHDAEESGETKSAVPEEPVQPENPAEPEKKEGDLFSKYPHLFQSGDGRKSAVTRETEDSAAEKEKILKSELELEAGSEATDATPHSLDPEEITECYLHELPLKCKNPRIRQRVIGECVGRINAVSGNAPSPLLDSLGKISRELQRDFQNDKEAEEVSRAILQAEESFFAGLKDFSEREEYLKNAERRLLPPGVRFHETLYFLRERQQRREEPLEELQKILDKYDAFALETEEESVL